MRTIDVGERKLDMVDARNPSPVLDYSNRRERNSAMAAASVFVSLVSFPTAVALAVPPLGLHHVGPTVAEVADSLFTPFLPLVIGLMFAMRAAVRVIRSRRTDGPMGGLDFAIAGILFSSAWIAVFMLGIILR